MPQIDPTRRGGVLEKDTASPGAYPALGPELKVRSFWKRGELAEAKGWAIAFAIVVVLTAFFALGARMGLFTARIPTGAESERRGQEPGETRGR